MKWFDLLKERLLKRVEPTWEPVYDEEYDRVYAAIQRQITDHRIHLQIIRHGPDQYSAYYVRNFESGKPLSVKREGYEPLPAPGTEDEHGGE